MTIGVENSHRIAEVALGALKELSLEASPRNIEVWCAHIDGNSPALSRDIQSALDADGRITQTQADALFRNHFQRSDLSNDVASLVARFHEEVADLYVAIEASGENASGHSKRLTDLTTELDQSTEEYPDVAAILESVVGVAKTMRAENQALEAKLAESADEVTKLQHSVEKIQAEAIKDPLTGLANRREFDKKLSAKIQSIENSEEPFSIVLADIDFFKNFNDKWGHQTGDQVLRLVAEVMNANVKGQDLLARYGGEEFAIILPETSLQNATMLANRIRSAVESRRLKKRRSNEDLGVITMSMGVAVSQRGDSAETIIERADLCLYAAKEAGRNRVISETPTRTPSEARLGAA